MVVVVVFVAKCLPARRIAQANTNILRANFYHAIK